MRIGSFLREFYWGVWVVLFRGIGVEESVMVPTLVSQENMP
jgi:hypothetical protein